MILGLHTATPVCTVIVDGETYTWEANRELAKGLLSYLQECIAKHGKELRDSTGIVVFQGPGSFTGLRIGIAVMNTLSDALHIPIVGTTGDNWYETGKKRLEANENDQIVLPEYGADANITQPRK